MFLLGAMNNIVHISQSCDQKFLLGVYSTKKSTLEVYLWILSNTEYQCWRYSETRNVNFSVAKSRRVRRSRDGSVGKSACLVSMEPLIWSPMLFMYAEHSPSSNIIHTSVTTKWAIASMQ